ncbi:MAG: archaellin/type IV pilin N-terminal domain-containing protein [Candidatus Nanoarchaeia archaeon]|jgi:flagellin-like protein
MNRKAITPVIAVVLLLMMTVAAAGAAFFWMNTIQGRIQGQIGTQVTTTNKQTGTSLNFVALICDTTNDSLNITLQNTGTHTIETGTVAVTVTDSQDRVLQVITTTLASNFDQDQITTLVVPDVTIMTENTTYGIKVTLPGGVEGTSDCKARI